jgi:diacylglycerol kinase family enzyme
MRGGLVVLALMASPAFAQDADAVASMTKAIEDAGCVVTAENGHAVLSASSLTEDETMAVIAALYGDGLVSLQADGTMKLTNDVCD